MQQYFPCYRCGAHNLVGSVSCGNCGQQLYYNCPHCGAWVDNRYINCPNCNSKLCWPSSPNYACGKTQYVPSNYAKDKKPGPWPAILVSVFVICLIALIFAIPGSPSAAKTDATNAILQTVKTGISASAGQPEITVSSPNGQASPAGSSAYLPANVNLTTSSGEVIEIQMTDGAGNSSMGGYTDSTGYTIKRSPYAQQTCSNCGPCSNGRCQGYTQP